MGTVTVVAEDLLYLKPLDWIQVRLLRLVDRESAVFLLAQLTRTDVTEKEMYENYFTSLVLA